MFSSVPFQSDIPRKILAGWGLGGSGRYCEMFCCIFQTKIIDYNTEKMRFIERYWREITLSVS